MIKIFISVGEKIINMWIHMNCMWNHLNCMWNHGITWTACGIMESHELHVQSWNHMNCMWNRGITWSACEITCMLACIHVWMHTCVHTHMHIHIHTHNFLPNQQTLLSRINNSITMFKMFVNIHFRYGIVWIGVECCPNYWDSYSTVKKKKVQFCSSRPKHAVVKQAGIQDSRFQITSLSHQRN